MSKKILLLIMVGFSVAVGGFWVLRAQDPPQTPTAAAPVQTDLSGTYTGTFDCEPLGLTGQTTLTITGNDFTTADGKTGRIVASTTGGYTAVALQMGTMTTAATAASTAPATPPVIVSMRARKSGTRLTLTPVAGAAMRCSFVPGRVARGKRSRTPAATGTEVAAPATTPVPTESPMPEQTPSPSPSPVPTPSPSPSGTPTPEPSPVPSPSPSPSGTPTPEPSPTPSGSPTPTPSPSPAEPAPSPTPTPSPSPRGL